MSGRTNPIAHPLHLAQMYLPRKEKHLPFRSLKVWWDKRKSRMSSSLVDCIVEHLRHSVIEVLFILIIEVPWY